MTSEFFKEYELHKSFTISEFNSFFREIAKEEGLKTEWLGEVESLMLYKPLITFGDYSPLDWMGIYRYKINVTGNIPNSGYVDHVTISAKGKGTKDASILYNTLLNFDKE